MKNRIIILTLLLAAGLSFNCFAKKHFQETPHYECRCDCECCLKNHECQQIKYVIINNDVYYNGHKISGVSSTSFKDLTDGYAKDAFNVYYKGEKIEGASTTSFELLTDGYARDAFNVYYRGKKID